MTKTTTTKKKKKNKGETHNIQKSEQNIFRKSQTQILVTTWWVILKFQNTSESTREIV